MSEVIIKRTQKWIEQFIIQLDICPFASVPYRKGKIDLQVSESVIDEEFLPVFLNYLISFIDEGNEISNSFLILPNYEKFEPYLELYYKCEELLKMSNSDSLVQLASFHPEYIYKDTMKDDPSNYRNRSPYAMIHLLRVEEVEAAIQSYGDTTKITNQNVSKLSTMSKTEITALIEAFKT